MKIQKQEISNGVKKTFVALVLIGILVGLTLPLVSSATTTNCCLIKRGFKFAGTEFTGNKCYGEVTEGCEKSDGSFQCSTTTENANWGVACVLNTVYKVVDLVFFILVVISVIIGLAGAYNILTAGGVAEKVNKGRDLIIYAIIGIIVAFFARAIPSIIGLIL
jgi:hypothetical protein